MMMAEDVSLVDLFTINKKNELKKQQPWVWS